MLLQYFLDLHDIDPLHWRSSGNRERRQLCMTESRMASFSRSFNISNIAQYALQFFISHLLGSSQNLFEQLLKRCHSGFPPSEEYPDLHLNSTIYSTTRQPRPGLLFRQISPIFISQKIGMIRSVFYRGRWAREDSII